MRMSPRAWFLTITWKRYAHLDCRVFLTRTDEMFSRPLPSAKLAPCTNTRGRPTKSFPSLKTLSSRSLIRRTPIGS